MKIDSLFRMTMPSPETSWRELKHVVEDQYRSRNMPLNEKQLEHIRRAYIMGYQQGYFNTVHCICSDLKKEAEADESKSKEEAKTKIRTEKVVE